MQMDVYWCQSDTDRSSRWVSNSSQGPPCAGTAEPFRVEPAKLHSHARSQSLKKKKKNTLILCGVKGHYIFKAGNGSGLFRDDNLQLQINNRILLLGRNAKIQTI